MAATNHGQDWGALVESVKYIKEAVEPLKDVCITQASQEVRIDRLEKDITMLAKKFWWGVTVIVLSLITASTWLWQTLTSTILGKH